MAVKSSIDSQFNPGQNPYDTYVGLDSAAESIDADIARSQLAQERAEQKRLREMQLADIKSKNMAGLMVSSETEYQPLQSYMQDMSRNLVDKYSSLVSQLEKGEIDSTYFAAESAKLQGQVPQVKQMVDAISGTAGAYAEGLAQGTLSGAIPKDQEMYFQAILDNRGSFGIDDNNILVFQGETADGKPFSIPANKLNQMPQPIGKVEDFQALVLPTVEALMKPEERNVGGRVVNASVIGPSADNPAGSQEWQNGVAASFDTFLKTYKENGLKSLAVDHSGYSIEEMNDALNSGMYEGPDGEEYSSRLEYEMEKKFTEIASENYVYKETENFNQLQADARRKTQQIQAMNANTARINAATAVNQGKTEAERQQYKTAEYMKNLPSPTEDLNSWLSQAAATKIRTFEKDTKQKGVLIPAGSIAIKDKGGKNILITAEILEDPNKLASFLSSRLYDLPPYMQSFNYKSTPPKNISPIKKISNFLTGKK